MYTSITCCKLLILYPFLLAIRGSDALLTGTSCQSVIPSERGVIDPARPRALSLWATGTVVRAPKWLRAHSMALRVARTERDVQMPYLFGISVIYT